VGKALGGGVPVGAALVSEKVAAHVAFGDHGSTYGGNLLACRAALCVLDELTTGGLMAHVARMGRHFLGRLEAMASRLDIIKAVRGEGLIWGIELARDATAVVPAGLDQGVIVNRTAETVVRLLPPMVITPEEADEALGRLEKALVAVQHQ
jgi:acetylornithine/succinyldiaminopimelate/putrescine aminotransferase